MNRIIGYFDLNPTRGGGSQTATALAPWWPQYLVIVLGITVQPFFEEYQKTGHWHLEGSVGRFVFALVVGVLIFPSVYRNAFDPDKPAFVQLCAIFAAGMGWQSLLQTATKFIGNAHTS